MTPGCMRTIHVAISKTLRFPTEPKGRPMPNRTAISGFVARHSIQLSYGPMLSAQVGLAARPRNAEPPVLFRGPGVRWFRLPFWLLLSESSGPGIGLTDALVPLRNRGTHDDPSDHRSVGACGGGGAGERHQLVASSMFYIGGQEAATPNAIFFKKRLCSGFARPIFLSRILARSLWVPCPTVCSTTANAGTRAFVFGLSPANMLSVGGGVVPSVRGAEG